MIKSVTILVLLLTTIPLTTSVQGSDRGNDDGVDGWLNQVPPGSPGLNTEDYETGSVYSRAMTDIESVSGSPPVGQSSPQKLQDVMAVRKYIRRGMLEVTPDNYKALTQATYFSGDATKNFDKGLWIRGWKSSQGFDALSKLLLRFDALNKLKVEINWAGKQQGALAEVLEQAIQFYPQLEELDITGCRLGDKRVENILDSLVHPEKMKVIKVKDNQLSERGVEGIRRKLAGLSTLDVEEGKDQGRHYKQLDELNKRARCGNKSAGQELLSFAEQGDQLAMAYVAIRYLLGEGLPKNKERAEHWAKQCISWLQDAATGGLSFAQTNLGYMYDLGLVVPQDYKEAARLYRLAADQKSAQAQNNLGNMYYEGQGVPQDDKEAVRLYRLAADQKHAQAQHNLGVMYEEGRGVSQDYKEAVRLYSLADDQGAQADWAARHTKAQFDLALMYDKGLVVPQDYKEAMRLYRLAADQGEAAAQHNLGRMYGRGLGVPQNYSEAVRLYVLAANQDFALALDVLGELYHKGIGVSQDYKEAVRLYSMVGNRGARADFAARYTDAQFKLGRMYDQGRGVAQNNKEAVRQNNKEAVRLYRLAADQGNADAKNNLGRMYEEGRGVAKSRKSAIKLYQEAERQGNSASIDARQNLRRLRRK